MYTVILVDDEMFVRKGLRSLIDWNEYGYEVVDEADNGEDALELIDRVKPDVVITDIRMPVLDGLELIGRTLAHNPQTSFIIVSGYNDFGYAQQAVRYGVCDFILKPIDERELTDALKQLADKIALRKLLSGGGGDLLKERMVESLIQGEFDDALAAGWAKELKVDRAKEISYAFIEVNDVHPWNATHPPSAEQMRERVKRAIEEEGLAAACEDMILKEHHGRFGILIASGRADIVEEGPEAYAAKLQRALEERLNTAVYVYVGKPVRDIALLRESYLSAKEALQYKYVRPDDRLVTSAHTQAGSVEYVVVDDAVYRRLLEQLEEQNTERLRSEVDALFRDFRDRRFAPEAVKSAVRHTVNGALSLLRAMDGDEKQLASLEPIVSWQDLNVSPAELKRLFTNFLLECAETILRLRKDFAKGGIQKIKTYIEAHYTENISLKSIASVFYMNPVYLGQLFKKTYGVHFNDFLLQLRIGEAKKLLRQTDCRVYEIAEKVGFGSPDYFVTRFEKLENMTPTEYRNKLLEK
jgi:two-component system response regulator YesN